MEINRREAIMASAGALLVGNMAKRSVNPKNLPVVEFIGCYPSKENTFEIAKQHKHIPWITKPEETSFKLIPVWVNQENAICDRDRGEVFWGECYLKLEKLSFTNLKNLMMSYTGIRTMYISSEKSNKISYCDRGKAYFTDSELIKDIL